ncbi:UbiA family prenyltransferase [Rhizobium sp. KVB221]|uniref:UbiA family prenyltransferase n=1 Tax=Rhizobium setariae TaxID=2801340 RepID=A0A936YSW4_9HYPH|nr:UbiA family prenyltransferase [Rhizobium setariae]MBL0373699.1 UbiA family prenyltransferase [Rhizobium setariae]
MVVDLDGTLTRTDLLFETFWSALSKQQLSVVPIAARSLIEGRAALKRNLAKLGPIDVTHLPYNDAVVDHVRQWRDSGGRTALVTASDQTLADAVAAHLGLFDEVHGSNGSRNLKGPEKAAFLAERYGEFRFTYIGDAEDDIDVWRIAKAAVTVDLPPGRRVRVDALVKDAEHLTTRASRGAALLKALRPHQWMKNVLIFLPMAAAHQFDAITLGRTILAFVAFSVIASSVYLLNDLVDLGPDRLHPRKRHRPFASGALPLATGTVLAPGLMAVGMIISLLLGPLFFGVMVCYYAVTTAYSFKLKRLLIVDICALACLYTLRIVAGGVAPSITLSMWLLAFSMFFFFSLAAMKRQAELISGVAAGELTAHGRRYEVGDMPLMASMAVSSGYVAILVLALYLQSDSVHVLYANPLPLWGICLVLFYWISRMVMITHRGLMHDDPVVFAARDRISHACGALVFALALAGTIL